MSPRVGGGLLTTTFYAGQGTRIYPVGSEFLSFRTDSYSVKLWFLIYLYGFSIPNYLSGVYKLLLNIYIATLHL